MMMVSGMLSAQARLWVQYCLKILPYCWRKLRYIPAFQLLSLCSSDTADALCCVDCVSLCLNVLVAMVRLSCHSIVSLWVLSDYTPRWTHCWFSPTMPRRLRSTLEWWRQRRCSRVGTRTSRSGWPADLRCSLSVHSTSAVRSQWTTGRSQVCEVITQHISCQVAVDDRQISGVWSDYTARQLSGRSGRPAHLRCVKWLHSTSAVRSQ